MTAPPQPSPTLLRLFAEEMAASGGPIATLCRTYLATDRIDELATQWHATPAKTKVKILRQLLSRAVRTGTARRRLTRGATPATPATPATTPRE
jgi:hypothetical protein